MKEVLILTDKVNYLNGKLTGSSLARAVCGGEG